MKEFNRASLPEQISYNNREFHRIRQTERKDIITSYCQQRGKNIQLIQVNVLHRRLKGREDLHGKPYQPSVFYYSSPKLAEWQEQEINQMIAEENKTGA